MFIRKRQSTKSPCYQVIETYREGGKVCQRVIYASSKQKGEKIRCQESAS
jgi:regulator of replication initiation timing